MKDSVLSCILHPIRMRIIQSLSKGKNMTVQDIAKELPDVPQATLYRHLKTLEKVKAIKIVQENKVRGTIEKVYALGESPYQLPNNNLTEKNKEDHLNFFYQFLMVLLGDFERYITQDKVDLEKDGVGFRSAALYLSDEEYIEFIGELGKVFAKAGDKGASPERRLRKISTIVLPEVEGKDFKGQPDTAQGGY